MTAGYFGEDPGGSTPEKLFAALDSFMRQLRASTGVQYQDFLAGLDAAGGGAGLSPSMSQLQL